MTRGSFGVALVLLISQSGCADRDVGLPAPDGQLYFPLGIRTLGFGSDDQRLAVQSTNFDQRFQSGQVSLIDADVIVDGVLSALGVTDPATTTCGAAGRPLFIPGFDAASLGAPAWLSRVRVPGIGGEMLTTPVLGEATQDRVFVTDRLTSSLLYIEREGDVLRCARGEETIRNTDCSDQFVTLTEAEDPFSLTRGVGPNGAFLAVGHLFGYIENFESFGVVTLFDEDAIVRRSRGESRTPFDSAFRFPGARGVSGIAFTSERTQDGLLVLSGANEPPLEFASIEFRSPGDDATSPDLVPVVRRSIRFDRQVGATGGRGLAVTEDGRRAVLSLRFAERNGVSSNAGMTIIDLTSDEFRILSIVEIGEELGRPVLRPSGPGEPILAFVGDLRADRIWVVDVTRDIPRVAGEIAGRARRALPDGRVIDARVLDAPTGIDFVRRGARTFAFVTNFANSTLALLDVTDSNPQRHCLLARIGRDLDADGRSEDQQ